MSKAISKGAFKNPKQATRSRGVEIVKNVVGETEMMAQLRNRIGVAMCFLDHCNIMYKYKFVQSGKFSGHSNYDRESGLYCGL